MMQDTGTKSMQAANIIRISIFSLEKSYYLMMYFELVSRYKLTRLRATSGFSIHWLLLKKHLYSTELLSQSGKNSDRIEPFKFRTKCVD